MIATKLKADDVMQTQVQTLHAATLVSDAIRFLEECRISGAPVVDDAGRVVGVLSLTDLARAAESERESETRPEYYLAEPLDELLDMEPDEFSAKIGYSPDLDPGGTAADWMTEKVISVKPEDSVRVVCKRMADNRIHRVLVLDEGRLCGIISTFDIVRRIAEKG